jgi:hypothetical protein
MPSLPQATANNTSYWSGIAGIIAIQLAVLFAVSAAALIYVNWSSNAALAEFMAGGTPSISRRNDATNYSIPIQHAKQRACAPRA